MNTTRKILFVMALAFAGGASANDSRYQPVPQLQGVWLTQIEIRDCVSGNKLAGPFPGIISFQAGGTIGETGPALPNSLRGPGFGVWRRIGRDTFSETLTFQRFDLTGIYLGTQVIHATPKVSADSQSYVGTGGTFEVKDSHGTAIGSGCSYVTATRL